MTDAVFAVETYAQVVEELQPLLPRHWAELAAYKDIPLDPDYELYRALETAGVLVIYTARHAETRALVGYSIFVARPGHPHYRNHGWALNDIVWIAPECRHLGFGRRLVAYWDADLAARGIAVAHVECKAAHPELVHLLAACGYAQVGVGMSKRLG